MTVDDGRAGQEAARLLAAAQEWLRTSAPHLAPVGPDGELCSCPLCRAVVSLRDTDPDVVGRWVDAAVAGVSAVLAQTGAGSASDSGEHAPRAEDADDSTDDSSDDEVADTGGAAGDSEPPAVRRIPFDPPAPTVGRA
jgi:hypothetical protein